MRYCAITVSAILSLCGPALYADIVYLKDGSAINGSVKRADDGWVITSAGIAKHFSVDQVESIELNSVSAPGPAAAAERLASLRRSVEDLSDLAEIIARFQRFIEQTTDPAVNADAKSDLAMWQDRQHQKMEKVGSAWVSPAEHRRLLDLVPGTVETARQLMKQGRIKEAEPLLMQVMAVDPHNASALFLIGLLRYQQDQFPAARKSFEAVVLAVPNHAPSLNNLAVVQWRQRQYVAALQNFDAAMLASPVNKMILDNVAVARQTLPPNLQKSPVMAKVIQHYDEQDQQLAEVMATLGLHRYGSLWVSNQDVANILLQEKQIQQKLDALAGQFDFSKQKIDAMSQTLSDDQVQIARIEATSSTVDPRTGFQVPIAYPSIYDELQRDAAKVQHDRDAEVVRLDAMKKQAQDLQNSRPGQKDRGVQRLIGVEGTPMIVGLNPQPIAAAATQPGK